MNLSTSITFCMVYTFYSFGSRWKCINITKYIVQCENYGGIHPPPYMIGKLCQHAV